MTSQKVVLMQDGNQITFIFAKKGVRLDTWVFKDGTLVKQ
jgi:hypothetical protein